MQEFKCRCSCLGNIMGPLKDEITEKQLLTLNQLEQKQEEKRYAGKDITEKQQETLDDLRAKRDKKPELSKTAKSFLEQWFIENMFNRRKEFTNKYLEKGIEVEDDAIELYSKITNRGFIKKNEENFKNEWVTGTPDIIMDIITDIKSSWDIFTFPLFDGTEEDGETIVSVNSGYWCQLQGYMWLKDKPAAELAYVLVDTPDELILKEANRTKWNAVGVLSDEDQEKLHMLIEKNWTFQDIPEELRVKVYKVERDDKFIESIPKRVQMCREYLEVLQNSISLRLKK